MPRSNAVPFSQARMISSWKPGKAAVVASIVPMAPLAKRAPAQTMSSVSMRWTGVVAA